MTLGMQNIKSLVVSGSNSCLQTTSKERQLDSDSHLLFAFFCLPLYHAEVILSAFEGHVSMVRIDKKYSKRCFHSV